MKQWWRQLELPQRIGLVATAVAVLSLVPAYLSLASAPRSSSDSLSDAARAVILNQRELSTRVDSVTQEVQRLRSEIDKLQKPTSQGRLAAQVGGMNEKVRQIDNEMSALQEAILRDPAKALEMPLLRRDIENNQLANQAALVAVRQDIDRQYDLMKWILGTFAVGIIGLIFTGISSRKEPKGGRDNP